VTSERLRLPCAAAVRVGRLERLLATAVAGWTLNILLPGSSLLRRFPAAPLGSAGALCTAAPYSAAGLWHHAAGNGNSGYEAPAAAPLADTDPRVLTLVDRQRSGRRNRIAAPPVPSISLLLPFIAQCSSQRGGASDASRESMQADSGSSVRDSQDEQRHKLRVHKPQGPLYQELAYQLSSWYTQYMPS